MNLSFVHSDLRWLGAQSLPLRGRGVPNNCEISLPFGLDETHENFMSIMCTFSFDNSSDIQVNKRN